MTSSALGFLLSDLWMPSLLAKTIPGLSDTPIVTLLAFNVRLPVLGMGMLILLLTPILLPIAGSCLPNASSAPNP